VRLARPLPPFVPVFASTAATTASADKLIDQVLAVRVAVRGTIQDARLDLALIRVDLLFALSSFIFLTRVQQARQDLSVAKLLVVGQQIGDDGPEECCGASNESQRSVQRVNSVGLLLLLA